uniref:GH18 domain-containing protein n=1 Tax=Pyrodinium bahamense TaxID=73915 RepID=A0A7S0AXI7_9DINO|mmetsp:Transcript_44396/g.123465  ORF Transcript_44396/g.123465 Transcript_44396/m.123465 type:complete len:457 (+) Transcript_44396:69-1439(+)
MASLLLIAPLLALAATFDAAVAHGRMLVAFVENWKACPSVEKIKGYDKAIVSFTVSYTWNPGKNQCDQSCTISTPATCDNRARPDLIEAWRQAGTKVLLSFGGAGMGGSWAGDRNDCWEYCCGRADSVVSQLVSIVRSQGFDGVDIDYEYFHSDQSDQFLKALTTGLRGALPAGKILSHAPMDGDVIPGKRYFNVLKEVASSVDYLLPQYYNGPTRPTRDLAGAVTHMGNLVNGIFGGDASKVVFGFCIADCSATGSNVDGAQAASVLQSVARAFPEYGGAFLWAASDDNGWSDSVKRLFASAAATPTTAPTSTTAPITAPTTAPTLVPTMAPTMAPTTAPTMSPTMSPTSAPTASPTPMEPGAGQKPAKCARDVSHHGSHFVGPCSRCLAANGVCYGGGLYDSEGYCTQWPANTWCGKLALMETRQAKGRQHAFRGTALVQTMSPLSRTVLGDEL